MQNARGSTSAPPLLRLAGVTKAFANGTTALAGLQLEIRRGEFLSLLGPSGCGKSTALRIIAGLSRATAGEVRWMEGSGGDRRSMTRTDAIGFVFQEPTLMPWASVEANVWLPLRLKGISRKDARCRIEECLALVGLTGFAQAYPRELSGGMKMRVSLARALAPRPRLLLMDEPFAALDEITRAKLNDDLLHIHTEVGATTVFVTHSVYESVYLSSRLLVMAARPGRVLTEIEIPEPMPRQGFRRTERYAALCAHASDALMGALAPSEHL